jgi:hypothetical protein
LALALSLAAALSWLAVGGLNWGWLDWGRPGANAAEVPAAVATAWAEPAAAKADPPAPASDGPYPIAHLPGDVDSFDVPGGQPTGTVAGEWWGYPSALPVIARSGGFLLVRLQQRPNQSTAWIAADGVEITTTPYRIVIDLAAGRLKLLNLGETVLDAPAVVGRPATPTPAGHFFVTMLQPGASAGYGRQVLVLSGHSETIDDWRGSGDAVIAIHGPLGDDASVDAAAAISNGCVRLHLEDLDALAELVPPGSPVDIG